MSMIFKPAVPAEIQRILNAVRVCPDRGSVLPHSRQPECGCAELTECRAGRGISGAVTLEHCVRCRSEWLETGDLSTKLGAIDNPPTRHEGVGTNC